MEDDNQSNVSPLQCGSIKPQFIPPPQQPPMPPPNGFAPVAPQAHLPQGHVPQQPQQLQHPQQPLPPMLPPEDVPFIPPKEITIPIKNAESIQQSHRPVDTVKAVEPLPNALAEAELPQGVQIKPGSAGVWLASPPTITVSAAPVEREGLLRDGLLYQEDTLIGEAKPILPALCLDQDRSAEIGMSLAESPVDGVPTDVSSASRSSSEAPEGLHLQNRLGRTQDNRPASFRTEEMMPFAPSTTPRLGKYNTVLGKVASLPWKQSSKKSAKKLEMKKAMDWKLSNGCLT